PDVLCWRERPALRAEPLREGRKLAGHLAASGRGGEFLRGRQPHRELGEFPRLARSGPAELPLQRTLQQIVVEYQPAGLDVIQEGGQRLGITDVNAAVPR